MKITKQFREKLDSLIQNAKSIKNSPETTLAWRSLQLAKAWLGKSLSYLGTANPYTPAATVDAIPPTADVATEPSSLGTDQLLNINQIRDEIQAQIDAIEANRPSEEKQRNCWDKCIEHLTEAKFWYGFELAEMREKARSEVKELLTEFLDKNPKVAEKVKDKISEAGLDVEKVATGQKISENENTSSKEEPSDAPPKEG